MLLLSSSSISLNAYIDVHPKITALVKERISKLPSERRQEIDNIIKYEAKHKREAIAYLFAFMPKYDLDTLPIAIIRKNIDYTFMARTDFQWAGELPLEIFYNDVLPYASMDETRENWREPFYKMLKPIVKDCKDVRAAIDTINKSIKNLTRVEYNTKRKKPNQSPAESMAIGMASCSGLSILLTNSLRAVGIPSRIAGTPLWMAKDGNHNWCEVWIDGEWYCIEYYPAPLNSGWILPKCAEFEGQNDPMHQVYATSFSPQSSKQSEAGHFPMVWSIDDKSIHGENVTQRYIDLYKSSVKDDKSKNTFNLSISVIRAGGNKKVSDDRICVDVWVFDEKENELAHGKSKGATTDMNDILTFYLPKAERYMVKYGNQSSTVLRKKGEKKKMKVYYETTVKL